MLCTHIDVHINAVKDIVSFREQRVVYQRGSSQEREKGNALIIIKNKKIITIFNKSIGGNIVQ